jgi:hypothetical protein
MEVTKYYTLLVLALFAAHHIFHISRIKVNSVFVISEYAGIILVCKKVFFVC